MSTHRLIAYAQNRRGVYIYHLVVSVALWLIALNFLVRAVGAHYSPRDGAAVMVFRLLVFAVGLLASWPALIQTTWLLVALERLPAVVADETAEGVWTVRFVNLIPGSTVVVAARRPGEVIELLPSPRFTNPWGIAWAHLAVVDDGSSLLTRHVPAAALEWREESRHSRT